MTGTNAVQRWAKGDKSITSAIIAKILWDEIYSLNFKTLDKKYSLFYFGLIDDRVKELRRTGTFAGISQTDTFSRLRILMTENLFAEYGSKGAEQDKRKWATCHQEKAPSNRPPDAQMLYRLHRCLIQRKSIPLKEHFEDYIRLYTELDSLADLAPYLQAALKIDIALKQDFLKELN